MKKEENRRKPMSAKTLTAEPSPPLKGETTMPGDKSIAHRALIFAALTAGRSEIDGLPPSEDVAATAEILRALGVQIAQDKKRATVNGLGIGGFAPPQKPLHCGNSGTTARLLTGALSGHGFTSFLIGDASLTKRPMRRLIKPLSAMGAGIVSRNGRLPLAITGRAPLLAALDASAGSSAQLKTAFILAALHARGESVIRVSAPSRDHTERMMPLFGGNLRADQDEKGGMVRLSGEQELRPASFSIPGDPSSAAFFAAAAILIPSSSLVIKKICVNPLRRGFYDALLKMGADLTIAPTGETANEPQANLICRGGRALRAIETDAALAPAMLDEYPLLAIVAAHAEGASRFRGLSELRIKESDRLSAILAGLKANGVGASLEGDDLTIEGCGGAPQGGGLARSFLDHRIAMAFLVLGLSAKRAVRVEGAEAIGSSFPGFARTMRSLGGVIRAPKPLRDGGASAIEAEETRRARQD